ncbi:unnamed protein product [Staurois parvus]|uniref:Uncharacterized protein n=1 Tax=Staurois parvus TaxID=386267 RepID=A0ABN9FQC3_9NEOB|nr:unnamed protein product [Staurois parvus]
MRGEILERQAQMMERLRSKPHCEAEFRFPASSAPPLREQVQERSSLLR